jgi:cysteine desulfurase family protein (TIGR01976 family)
MPLDLTFVRSQFPALADGFAYFDNAGGTVVLQSVADRVRDYLLTSSVQTGASYAHSQRAVAMLTAARARIATMVGVTRPEEIVIGPSSTVLGQFLARAMLSRLKPGDEVVVTAFDHESNIGQWRWLERFGIVLRTWGLDRETFEIDLDQLDAVMTEKTKLVAVTHVSNILGTVNPIAEIARRVHARGAEIVVDGVAFAPHRLIDFAALDVDFYFFSFYKTYGPHLAALCGKYDKLLELDGLYHYFYEKDRVPMKLEPGNANYELIWGTAGIVDYLEQLGGGAGRQSLVKAFEDISAHEATLSTRLLAYLNQRKDVRVVGRTSGAAADRVPTIAFKVADRDSREIVLEVDKADIGIRYGDFHSRGLIETLGLAGNSGAVRVSMVHYNTIDEVDRLIYALERTLG